MTKKDFIRLAYGVKAALHMTNDAGKQLLLRTFIEDSLIPVCQSKNSNFDSDKFREACGL